MSAPQVLNAVTQLRCMNCTIKSHMVSICARLRHLWDIPVKVCKIWKFSSGRQGGFVFLQLGKGDCLIFQILGFFQIMWWPAECETLLLPTDFTPPPPGTRRWWQRRTLVFLAKSLVESVSYSKESFSSLWPLTCGNVDVFSWSCKLKLSWCLPATTLPCASRAAWLGKLALSLDVNWTAILPFASCPAWAELSAMQVVIYSFKRSQMQLLSSSEGSRKSGSCDL